MTAELIHASIVADVKCYYCGHVSGQIAGRRGRPLRVSDFVPRPGYQGPPVRPGVRLRCERCDGPVFLEDVTTSTDVTAKEMRLRLARSSAKKRRVAA